MELPVLDQPLNTRELRQRQDRDGFVKAVVKLPLSRVIDADLEAFLDALSEALTDTVLLMDFHYELVGCQLPDVLLFKVTGDPSLYLDTDGEVE